MSNSEMNGKERPGSARTSSVRRSGARPLIVRLALLVAIVIGALALGAAAFVTARGVAESWSPGSAWSGPQISAGEGTPAVNEQGTPLPTTEGVIEGDPSSAGAAIAPSLAPWDGAGRVTVLLLGLDYRDWSTGTDYNRSDTMILLTLDPQKKTAGILSVPRDLWVPIPGYQHGKINTAYYLGEAHKLPGGGPGLAVKTVEQTLGIQINYYAQIDFAAFVQFIDEIEGVEIDVPEKITIDLLGGGPKTKKTLQPGRQVLPGEWALAYARARYTQGGDFDRARRQQQVILGIRERILSFDMLPGLIAKAPTLYRQLASGINTNLSLEQVLQLALLAQQVPEENIQRGVIGEKHVTFGFSDDNLSILIPRPDQVALLVQQIFATGGALGPETPGNAQQQMQAEAARLVVLDGSGTPGLAERVSAYLQARGANVVRSGAADEPYRGAVLIDYTGNPYTLKYLAELLDIPAANIRSQFDPTSQVDVELVLGSSTAGNPVFQP